MATTGDHVPPKLLLEVPFPANLTTVPACSCNGDFSDDEQYFWVLLGQISPAETMVDKVQPGGVIDRTLERAPKLDARLLRHIEPTPDGANVYIKIEHNRVDRVLGKIAAGLYFNRYRRTPPPPGIDVIGGFPYTLKDYRPLGLVASAHSERFGPKQWIHVQRGVFSYIFVRDPRSYGKLICIMDFHQTMWGAVRLPQPRRGSARYLHQVRLLNEHSAA